MASNFQRKRKDHMSGEEVVRHEKAGPRESFFHGRSVSDRCDVCKLGEERDRYKTALEEVYKLFQFHDRGPMHHIVYKALHHSTENK